ncbi:hypothetical protein SXGG_00018 [Synechococcus phage S-CBP42]|uniref:Portal protein n=1 Tax=Synechococcus phage S-CBP42 TaxID=461711 RepID=G8EYD7_9CAUD|nr:hypothetical protein SXGG_00018 [Synechococcus phage S-CBP42]
MMPTVVAGLYGVGRGQDRQALVEFIGTIAQSIGPEAVMQYINPGEFLKRLAAASGIDSLSLIKDPATMEQEAGQMKQDAMMQSLVGQAGQLAKSPMGEQLTQQLMSQQNGTAEQEAIEPPGPPS